VSQPKIAEKITKNPYFEGSRSFKVIDVDSNRKLVTSARLYLSATIFTLQEIIAVKYPLFSGVDVFDARLHRPP